MHASLMLTLKFVDPYIHTNLSEDKGESYADSEIKLLFNVLQQEQTFPTRPHIYAFIFQ